MFHFNRNSLLILVSTLGLSLSGCSLDRGENSEETRHNLGAQFWVASSKVESLSYFRNEAGVKNAVNLSFTACLKRSKDSTELENGQTFQLSKSYEQTSGLPATSDRSGCIKWNDKVQFDPKAARQLVTLNYRITGLGQYPGSIETGFAINPWDGEFYSMVSDPFETDKESLVPAEKALQAFNGEYTAKVIAANDLEKYKSFIVIRDMRVNNSGFSPGKPAKLRLNLRTELEVRTKNRFGQFTSEPLPSAENLKIEFAMISSMFINGKEERRIISKPEWVEAKATKSQFVNDYLQPEVELHFDKVPQTGSYFLAVKISSGAQQTSYESYEGLLLWGTYLSTIPTSFSRPIYSTSAESPDFSLEKWLNESPALTDSNVFLDATYFIPKTNGFFVTQQELPSETIYNHKRRLVFTFQIFSAIDFQPVRAQKFQITKFDGSKIDVISNEAGFINFIDDIEYNWLGQECSYVKNINIKALQADFERSIPIEYNPWSQQAGAFLDISGLGTNPPAKDCVQEKATLIPLMAGMVQQNLYLDVDSYLNLNLTKRFHFNSWANVNRPTKSGTFNKEQRYIPPGFYVLKYAYYDHMLKPETVHFATKGLIYADGYGAGMSRIDFKFDDPVAQYYNLMLAVEIIPANQKVAKETCRKIPGCMDRINKQDFIPLEDLKLKDESSLLDPSMYVEVKTYFSPFRIADSAPSLSFKAESVEKGLFDRLFSLHVQQKTAKEKKLKALKGKAAFAKNFRVDRVDMSDPSAFSAFSQDLNAYQPNDWLSGSNPLKIDPSSLRAAFKNRKMGELLKPIVCSFWIDNFLKNKNVTTANMVSLNAAKNECEAAVNGTLFGDLSGETAHINNWFDTNYVYFIEDPKNTERSRFGQGAMQINFHKASAFSRERTYSEGWSLGFEIEAVLQSSLKILKLGIGGQGAYSYSWRKGEGRAEEYAHDLSGTIDIVKMPLAFSRVEACFMIKPNAGAILGSTSLASALNPMLSKSVFEEALQRGLLICDKEQIGPKTFSEKYYFVNQSLSAADGIIDRGNNRPFAAGFRSDLEFVKLANFLQLELKTPESSGPRGSLLGDLSATQRKWFQKDRQNFSLSSGEYPGVIIRQE
jgi:hypothetical protein